MYSIIDMTGGNLIAQTEDKETAYKVCEELNDLQKQEYQGRFIVTEVDYD